MTDYKAANARFRVQKSALTRAQNSGDPAKVLATVKRTVQEWNDPSGPFACAWPDAWSRWQRALDDAFGWKNPYHVDDFR